MDDFDPSDSFRFRSPHGMKSARGRLRTIAGIEVRHLQHFNRPGRAWHDLSDEQNTLSIVLAEIGGRCEARTNLRNAAELAHQRPNHLSYVPAQMKVWGYTDNVKSVRELRLSFDQIALSEILREELNVAASETPLLMFHDQRSVECARLLAAECDSAEPAADLYAEGLLTALLSSCFQRKATKTNVGLPQQQLRRVYDFMHSHLTSPVSLPELASLVDLSPSHFARMFKRSTGLAPHRYLMNARVVKAQELLVRKAVNLSVIATATGFADQSHFTRVFKKVTGMTPDAWRTNLRP